MLRWAFVFAMLAGCTKIRPGRSAIDRIDVEGGTEISASEIEDRIATAASPKFLGLFRGVVLDYELFDRYVLERDLARIERLYRARGYYDAHVRAGRVEKTGDNHVRVEIVVDEGLVVNVGEVRLEGVTGLPIDDAAVAFAAVRRLRHGRPFDEDRMETARQRLASALADRGYAYAKIEATAEVDLVRREADVTFHVEPSGLSHLGAVTINGLEGIPEEPVRRALDLATGDLYSESKLESGRRAVLALGVFSDADVSAVLTDPSSGVVPVSVRLVPTKLRAVKLGGGIELDQIRADVHLALGWEDRNFLGGLRRLSIDNRPGLVLEGSQLPGLKPPRRLLFEDRSRLELRQPGFLEARTGGTVRAEFNMYPVLFKDSTPDDPVVGYRDLSSGIGVDRSFGPLYTSLFYNFQTSFPFDYHGQAAEGLKDIMLSYLALAANLDFRNNAIHPHEGVFFGNELQVARNPFVSSSDPTTLLTNDWRLQSEVRGFVPLTRRTTLALRAMVGFLSPSTYVHDEENYTSSDVQQVYFRGFFSGGPSSNRGYAYRDIGPKGVVPFLVSSTDNATLQTCTTKGLDSAECLMALQGFCEKNPGTLVCDFPTGGISVWEASIELRFPLARDFEGAVFCDASDVSKRRFNLRWLYPHLSCGVGLHYDTPVGPLRLDVGYQLPGLQVFDPNADPKEEPTGSPFAISIGIGEAF
jgi:outer membrane protein insertion porin family/translocation and assembly module TamA